MYRLSGGAVYWGCRLKAEAEYRRILETHIGWKGISGVRDGVPALYRCSNHCRGQESGRGVVDAGFGRKRLECLAAMNARVETTTTSCFCNNVQPFRSSLSQRGLEAEDSFNDD